MEKKLNLNLVFFLNRGGGGGIKKLFLNLVLVFFKIGRWH